MRIVPYRVRFEPDMDSAAGKYRYSKPTNDRLPVPLSEDGTYYRISTHDRGDHEKREAYYQIAFRIEDPSPYSLEELSLHLDSAIYRSAGQQISNDLFCDRSTKLDPEKNLWFQRSCYELKDGEWKIVAENHKGKGNVDCITTAGVFGIVVKRNGVVLKQHKQPWVYVLPSSISRDDYIAMLSDLIRLNEALVRDDRHATGIGKLSMMQRETDLLNTEADIISELADLLKKIMKQPSELLRKRYVKSPIRKIKQFDGKVLRDYIRNRGAPGTTGIAYTEDHDTYENRVIRYVVEKMCRRPPLPFDRSITSDSVSEAEVAAEYELLTSERKAKGPESRRLSFSGIPQSSNWPRPLSVIVDRNRVSMSGHNAFCGEGASYNNLTFYASSRQELLFYLEKICCCYSELDHSPPFRLDCLLIDREEDSVGNFVVPHYYIKNIKRINERDFIADPADINDALYVHVVRSLQERYTFLKINNESFSPKWIRKPKHVIQSYEEQKHMENDIRRRLKEKKAKSIASGRINDKNAELKKLHDAGRQWFSQITLLPTITEVRKTPKFTDNFLYARLYDLIVRLMEIHPLLSASFEMNAFGVNSTQRVYEYWVFYKLLYHLKTLGFAFKDMKQARQDLLEHFKNFVAQKQPADKYSRYRVNVMKHSAINPIEMEIGYDMPFVTAAGSRTPDFYLCIKHADGLNWFFLDAKYKSYDRSGYLKEILRTSIVKYICHMARILHVHPEYSPAANNILGSYIIMADAEDRDKSLADNNRLFGGPCDISEELPEAIRYTKAILNNHKHPEHKYGAIVLAPSHDKELTSLFQLIFEYLDGHRTDDAKNNLNLYQCWNCGSEDIVRGQQYTFGKLYKYHVTCKRCGSFRVDTHCHGCSREIGPSLIVKHSEGNYHRYDDSVDSSSWAFLCPHCGKGLALAYEDILEDNVPA